MNQNQSDDEQLTERHVRALINVYARNSRKKRDVKLANEATSIIVERFIRAHCCRPRFMENPMPPTLSARLEKLEAAAEQAQPKTSGFGQAWFLLNWIYRRDTPLTPDEYARLDKIDLFALMRAEHERVFGETL